MYSKIETDNMITSLDQLDLSKRYTYADYLTWQFDEMVELIRGKIYKMSPAPNRRHQKVSSILTGEFYLQFKGKNCEFYDAPFDVGLLKSNENHQTFETVVQPDLCVICDANKLDEQGCIGAPDLIVEILSPRTRKKDYHEKFDLYEENGVKEYWLVDPDSKTAEIYVLHESKYERLDIFDKNKTLIESAIFPELKIEWKDVFGD